MWTKLHAADRIVTLLTLWCLPPGHVGRRLHAAGWMDRVVGEALQMDGGHLTGTLKLLKVVSDRPSPAGTGPA
jgi:hypothetical protein